MEKIPTIFSNQIFIKIYPEDGLGKNAEARNNYKYVKNWVEKLREALVKKVKNGEEIDPELLQRYSEARSLLYRTERDRSLLQCMNGIYRIWMLNSIDSNNLAIIPGKNPKFILSSTNGDLARSFNSIDEILDEFITLEDFVEKAEFYGRKVIFDDAPYDIYLLYKLDDVVITLVKDKKDNGIEVCSGHIVWGNVNENLTGPVNESLRGLDKLKKHIYKLKQENDRQID